MSICQSMVKTHEDGKMFQPLPDFSPFSMAERTEEYAGTGKKEARRASFSYKLWIMVSGGRITTRALSATDSVRKALPPTTAFSPMVVSPPKMEAPE